MLEKYQAIEQGEAWESEQRRKKQGNPCFFTMNFRRNEVLGWLIFPNVKKQIKD